MGKTRTLRILIAAALLLGFGAAVGAQITSNGLGGPGVGPANRGVLPPHSNPYGQSYSEWSANWWQWNYSLPVDSHPLFDTADCSEGQSGPVWYLGGTFTAQPDPNDPNVIIGEAVRECTVPTSRALFFPIVNAECNTIENEGATEGDLRGCANFLGDHIQNLQVTVDGEELRHLGLYRAESPFYSFGPLPDNNVLGVAPGTTANSVADGFFVMLAPLSKGEHEVHFSGAAIFTVEDDGFDFAFILDIAYHLTVERRGRSSVSLASEQEPKPNNDNGISSIRSN